MRNHTHDSDCPADCGIVAEISIDEAERQTLIEALDILLGVFDDWGKPLDTEQEEDALRAQLLLDTLRVDGDKLDHGPAGFRLGGPNE